MKQISDLISKRLAELKKKPNPGELKTIIQNYIGSTTPIKVFLKGGNIRVSGSSSIKNQILINKKNITQEISKKYKELKNVNIY